MSTNVRNARPLLACALLLAGLVAVGHAVPPSAPWASIDVGARRLPGSVDVDSLRRWLVQAANGDIGTFSKRLDNFFLVHHPFPGDGSILTLLVAQEGGHEQWGKAGIMIREDSSPGARNLFLGMTSGHGLLITYRPVAKKGTVSEGAERRYGPRRFPMWLRLQREGDRFTPFSSTDGIAWTQLHSPIVIPRFRADALAGIATASYMEGVMVAVFNEPFVLPGRVSPIVQSGAGNGAVLLTWPPVTGAIGYMVRRSAPNAPGFIADVLTPLPIRETSFSDTGLVNGQPLRYLVSAVFELNGELTEGWPTAVTTEPLLIPGDLFGSDINVEATQLQGRISFQPASGAYRITGSGGGVGARTDRCYCASRFVKGEFQVTARLLDRPTRTSPGAKAGLMIRESLDGPSRMIFLGASAAEGAWLLYRKKPGEAAGGTKKPVIGPKQFQVPLYLRLVRQGATVSAFVSLDGSIFKPLGKPQRFDPPLAESLHVGYAITSEHTGAMASSTFMDFTIQSSSVP